MSEYTISLLIRINIFAHSHYDQKRRIANQSFALCEREGGSNPSAGQFQIGRANEARGSTQQYAWAVGICLAADEWQYTFCVATPLRPRTVVVTR